jgi:hypothetical protein
LLCRPVRNAKSTGEQYEGSTFLCGDEWWGEALLRVYKARPFLLVRVCICSQVNLSSRASSITIHIFIMRLQFTILALAVSVLAHAEAAEKRLPISQVVQPPLITFTPLTFLLPAPNSPALTQIEPVAEVLADTQNLTFATPMGEEDISAQGGSQPNRATNVKTGY